MTHIFTITLIVHSAASHRDRFPGHNILSRTLFHDAAKCMSYVNNIYNSLYLVHSLCNSEGSRCSAKPGHSWGSQLNRLLAFRAHQWTISWSANWLLMFGFIYKGFAGMDMNLIPQSGKGLPALIRQGTHSCIPVWGSCGNWAVPQGVWEREFQGKDLVKVLLCNPRDSSLQIQCQPRTVWH